MKTKNLFKLLILTLFVSIAVSCGSDEEDGGGEGQVSSISLSVTNNNLNLIVGSSTTFSVINNLNSNVTSTSEIKVDGTAISGDSYTFTEVKDYSVVASNAGLTASLTIHVLPVPVPDSITLTSDVRAFWVSSPEEARFTIMDNLGNDLSTISSIKATSPSGVEMDIPNEYTFNELGDHNVLATFTLESGEELVSNAVVVSAVEPSHTTKVLVEDYTGTWCGYCPRIAYALEDAVGQNANVVAVAIHDDEEMLFPNAAVLESTFGVEGFPTGKINRVITWPYPETASGVLSYLEGDKILGLAISSSVSGNTVNAEVKVHYDLPANGSHKLVVYLLESGLAYDQVNYYNEDSSSPGYGQGNPIPGFIHNHVARVSLTNVLGDAIPASETGYNSIYTANLSVAVPASVQNTSNLELVAFVVGEDKKVINAQKADVGSSQDFD